jgi:crotonobetaine/carnitine-CoA ligase
MVNILMSRPEGPEDRAHSVRVALAPATPPDLFDRFGERFGLQLLEGYGSTETNGALFSNWREQRAGFMGPAREGFEAIVADDEDGEVPDGVDGELLLRNGPPFAFATGYFGMPEKTVEAWRNLWFHTGDRVVREPDGWFRFVDRIKDTIRRRGENISSFEVEQALLSHPAVSAAAAFPVASEMAEDEVAAAVVLEDGAELTPEELMRHCEPRLAYFAIPRFLRFVDELPQTANGKVRKSVLREAGVLDGDWDREAVGFELKR